MPTFLLSRAGTSDDPDEACCCSCVERWSPTVCLLLCGLLLFLCGEMESNRVFVSVWLAVVQVWRDESNRVFVLCGLLLFKCGEMESNRVFVLCGLLHVPATGECISGTDRPRQLCTLQHPDTQVAAHTSGVSQSQRVTPGQPALTLTHERQTPSMVAGMEPHVSGSCGGRFTTGPLRRSGQASNTATRGVTVSMSAFLACHQCYCAGSSLAWGLNLRAVVCGIF